jgi:hypothetical protein
LSLTDLNIHFVLGTTQAIKAMILQHQDASILSPYTILPHEQPLYHVLDVEGLSLFRHLTIIHHNDLAHPTAGALIRTLLSQDWGVLLQRQ